MTCVLYLPQFWDLDDGVWDATYRTLSPVDISPSPFWAVDAIIRRAVREEIGRQNSGDEREETLPGGITTSAPSQRSTVSRLSSLLDHIRGKAKRKKTNDEKEHRNQIKWIHYSEVSQTFIPVRQKNGGGNRYISYNAIQAPSIAFLSSSSETSSFLDNSRYESLLFKVDKLIYRAGHLILRALAIRASDPQNALAWTSFYSPTRQFRDSLGERARVNVKPWIYTLWCLEHCCVTFLSVTSFYSPKSLPHPLPPPPQFLQPI